MTRKLFTLIAGLLAAGCCGQARKPAAFATAPVRRVVLVHGFLETGSNFTMLKQRLDAVLTDIERRLLE